MFLDRLFSKLVLALAMSAPACAAPDHVYLTWKGDTSTSIVVHYHTADESDSVVHYQLDSDSAAAPSEAKGSAKRIPGLKDGRYIHSVEITGLSPGATYKFKTGSGKDGKFRPLPNDGSKIRGIFGGDIGIFPLAAEVLKQAAAVNPDVAVLGGDIAYANGDLKNILAWDIWLKRWEDIMVREDGVMIPAIIVIGNHEVNKSQDEDPLKRAPFYFNFFDQGGSTYFTRALGPHAHLIGLDSGHITEFEPQVSFIETALAEGQKKPFVFASYHVPQYPSHRSFDDARSVSIRNLWQPLFDEYKLDIGFEHHDHTFKRTKPIRANKVDPAGTIYLGDGSMGVAVRDIRNKDEWYLERTEEKAHFWQVDISADKVECRAIDHLGQQFDEVTVTKREGRP